MPDFNTNSVNYDNSLMTGYGRERNITDISSFPIEWFSDIPPENFWKLYRRCDIASTAINIIPNYVWDGKIDVKIFNSQGTEIQNSQLEKMASEITRRLKPDQIFKQAHIYARVTGFGLVVAGFADNLSLANPLTSAKEIIWLKAFSSDQVTIKYDENPASPTFGDILNYEITIQQKETNKIIVHKTRAWMVYEGIDIKRPKGISALEAPYNLINILMNTDWSAGESYYQNSSPLYIVSWDDSITAEPITPTEREKVLGDMSTINARKKIAKPKSWTIEVIQGSGKISDPRMLWESLIERIAGAFGIPKQLLLGTSAGALASGEVNMQQVYKDISLRQTGWAEPYLLDFFTRLQNAGILPSEDTMAIIWPTHYEMDEKEKAEIGKLKIETAKTAVESGLMTIPEARKETLGLNEQVGEGSDNTFLTNTQEET
jgi:phage-related protein (TIGR01555 family)